LLRKVKGKDGVGLSDCEEISGGSSLEMMGLVLDWPNRGEVRRRRENVVMSVYLLGFSIGWFSRT